MSKPIGGGYTAEMPGSLAEDVSKIEGIESDVAYPEYTIRIIAPTKPVRPFFLGVAPIGIMLKYRDHNSSFIANEEMQEDGSVIYSVKIPIYHAFLNTETSPELILGFLAESAFIPITAYERFLEGKAA